VTPDKLIRPEILAVKAYNVGEADGMVKLDAMENPYPLPEAQRRELAEVLARVDLNRYPEPSGRKLRELLARKMRVPQGMELLLGNGSDDLIQIVTLALARPGAAMMFPVPTFVMYGMNATLTGMRAVAVPLREDFSFDADAFVARMRAERPALVFLAYPNNPTGVLYPEEDVPPKAWWSSTRPTTCLRARASCRGSPNFRTSSSSARFPSSAWRAFAWATLPVGPNGSPSSIRCARPTTSAC
jgi:histidinol-phosphate/aromatic aminotransferase/cobyric acid decarboxylase-like protein